MGECAWIECDTSLMKQIQPYRRLISEWQEDDRIDKLYSIRSTRTFEQDPFRELGADKLLYVDRLFSNGVTEWRALLQNSRRNSTVLVSGREHSAASRLSMDTDHSHSSATPRGTVTGVSQGARVQAPSLSESRLRRPPLLSRRGRFRWHLDPRLEHRHS